MKNEKNSTSKPTPDADLSKLSPEEKRKLLAQLLTEKKAAPRRRFPLAPAQERLCFIDALQPGQTVYHIPITLRLTGSLDANLIQQCLSEIITRHEILRTSFVSKDGIPQQEIIPELSLPPLVREDDPRELYQKPFQLHEPPLLRAQLVPKSPESAILHLVVHHIIADYWSLRILLFELQHLYAARQSGKPSPLPELRIQYLDYAVWQNQQKDEHQRELSYWSQQLAGVPPLLRLPGDFQRPAQPTFQGARHRIQLDASSSDALTALAREENVTSFSAMLALFQGLLFRYTEQDDFCIGSTISNREREETQNLIGLFVNNIVFRCQPQDSWNLREWVCNTHQTVIEGLRHQQVPFERVVDALKIDRQLNHNPLFQVQFLLRPAEEAGSQTQGGFQIETIEPEHATSRFDLSLELTETANGFQGFLEYSSDLFHPGTIARLGEHLALLLSAATKAPDQRLSDHALLTASESEQLATWNENEQELPSSCAHELISQQAALTPDAPAISFKAKTLSYQELESRSNQLANFLLTKLPASSEPSPIALCLPRSEMLPIALLAILKTGSPYLPLDPKHPKERLQTILNDADSILRLTPEILADESISTFPETLPEREQTADQLAYLIYTSGSTGTPKGVPIQHRSLVNLLLSMAEKLDLQSEDTLLAITTIAFDIATLELLLPLITGAHICLADEETPGDGDALIRLLEQSQATLMQATPATWRLLLENQWQGNSKLKILCGGEALDLPLAHELLKKGKSLWNLYGPTETTIWSGALALSSEMLAENFVPIGGALANTGLHLLDQNRMEVPIGVPGELHLSGVGLSPGYHRRDNLTDEKFFTSQGTRLYATGDRARFRPDGTLEFLGRIDHQIKLRGFRIELGEIESLLTQHPDIELALVALEDERLISWCLNPKDNLTAPALHAMLKKQLPPYMVPSEILIMERFPLNQNGKVDRKQLPQPAASHSIAAEVKPLKTEAEKKLALIWVELLERPIENAATNFFEAGGHSLLVARMAARIRVEFEIDFPLRAAFDHPILADLAGKISQNASSEDHPIEPRPSEVPLRLSDPQQRQWVLIQLDPSNTGYQIPAALRVRGEFSDETLDQAIAKLCARHEVLHTIYPADESGRAAPTLVTPCAPEIEKLKASEAELLELLSPRAHAPFDLSQAPLLRITRIRLSQDEQVILFVIPHLVGDDQSLRILLRDFLAFAQGKDLPALPFQYGDYAHHQRNHDYHKSLAYWKEKLSDSPLSLDLPKDFARQAEEKKVAQEVSFQLSSETTSALGELAQKEEATLFMVLLTGLNILLHRYSGQSDLVIGSPVAQRSHPVWEDVVGMFVNALPLRNQVFPSESFTQLLTKTRETVLAALEHQEVPFEKMISVLNVDRDWDSFPIFQVLLVWRADPASPQNLSSDFSIEPMPLPPGEPKFDLTIFLTPTDGGLIGKFQYHASFYHEKTIQAMVDTFSLLLCQLAAHPTRMISELALTQSTPNPPLTIEPSQKRLHHLFEEQALRTPTNIAVQHPEGSLTYAELNEQADAVAAALQAAGVGPEVPVGLCLNRTPELVVAIYGILKSGGIYVALDPAYPTGRIHLILDDAQVPLVLCDDASEALIPEDVATRTVSSCLSDQAPFARCKISGENPAYLIYTSGSTGRPKGVTIEHRNAVAFVKWAQTVFHKKELKGVLASTSVCFDLSVFELFVPLASGGSLILADHALALIDHPLREKITLINSVPSAVSELLRAEAIPTSVRTINIAGEPLGKQLVDDLYHTLSHPEIAIYNLYGPSEDTTYSTFCQTVPDEKGVTTPIGKAVAETASYLLDERLDPVPEGMIGDLYLAGAGVARGYWNNATLTAANFLPNPFSKDGSPIYRTGDRARLRPDGSLEFLGRADQQIKLRGFRIELAEIEQILLSQADIKQAVLALQEKPRKTLTAYLVRSQKVERATTWSASADETLHLRAALAQNLPTHMIPSFFVELPELPKLPNGKINRARLPAPDFTAEADRPTALPQTEAEQLLATIWQERLGIENVDLHDNFFALGGDSILVLQIIAQVQQAGFSLTARILFQNPTIASLAPHLRAVAQKMNTLPSDQKIAIPLTPIQEWFFNLPLNHRHHWNQSFLFETPGPLDEELLAETLRILKKEHPALRANFQQEGARWNQTYQPWETNVPLKVIELPAEHWKTHLAEATQRAQASFNLFQGHLWQVLYLKNKDDEAPIRRLFISFHHLIIDGVSWRIFLTDFQLIYRQLREKGQAQLPPQTTPIPDWITTLPTSSASAERWKNIETSCAETPLPCDLPNGSNLMGQAKTLTLALTPEETQTLLSEVPKHYRIEPEGLLLTALSRAVTRWTGHQGLALQRESHGRQDHKNSTSDLSRTIAWLTSLYPVLLPAHCEMEPDSALKSVKDTLQTLPDEGLSYQHGTSSLPKLRFNYLGQTDHVLGNDALFKRASEPSGQARHPEDEREVIFDINALVMDQKLMIHWIYSPQLHHPETLEKLGENFLSEIRTLSSFCLGEDSGAGYTESEFPQMDFAPGELDSLLDDLE